MRRATGHDDRDIRKMIISTHALHAESDQKYVDTGICAKGISTHALHAESDIDLLSISGYVLSISTHALQAESDAKKGQGSVEYGIFLPTLSMRRATFWCVWVCPTT